MLHNLENHRFICKIESKGAELRSLFDKKNDKEYIWPINPSIWNSSAPVLFPSIGNIRDGKIKYRGTDYSMPKHGVIRNNDQLTFKQLNQFSCGFKLVSSQLTKAMYPFDFIFEVIYTLEPDGITMTYVIQNMGIENMLFSCGGHTAYYCPLNNGIGLNDYVIEFPDNANLEAYALGASGFLSNNKHHLNTTEGVLQLSNSIFNNDALIFKNIGCDWVRLRLKDESRGVVVSFPNYPNLALWAKPGADFVCIEPWLGLPDGDQEPIDITGKTSYKCLSGNQKFSIAIKSIIE